MTITRQRAVRAIVLLLLVVLLIGAGQRVAWQDVLFAIRGADARLLALALVMNLASLALKGVRWWVFLRPLGVSSLALVLRATFAGASLNNLVIAQGGEGARVLLVSRMTGVSSAQITAALALERLLDILSYLSLLVAATWMLELPATLTRWRVSASVLLALAVVGLSALAMVSHMATEPRNAASSYLQRFVSSFRDIATSARLAVAIALSLGAWALQVATYHSVAVASHLPISLAGSVAAMLAIGISFLIRATPGNVGVFQVIYALTVRSFGIPETAAVAVALLIQTIQVLPVVLIGTWLAPGLLLDGSRQHRAESFLDQSGGVTRQ